MLLQSSGACRDKSLLRAQLMPATSISIADAGTLQHPSWLCYGQVRHCGALSCSTLKPAPPVCCAAPQVSDRLADQLHDSYTLADVMGSDHCPIGLVVKH